PAFAIGLTGIVGLIALALDVTTSTSFINFGVAAQGPRENRSVQKPARSRGVVERSGVTGPAVRSAPSLAERTH
ncbi:hypothetical protein ABZU76_43670, partial [Amycolatopsis sp. NPDC005232]|uniref:hypothetical protein n=1 Tax=Amycolatopsis sp. NPDC005232 TaxID=3157027 RepID=UPI0033B649D3